MERQRWEYCRYTVQGAKLTFYGGTTVHEDEMVLDDELNHLGQDAWEMVSETAYTHIGANTEHIVRWWTTFKRPCED